MLNLLTAVNPVMFLPTRFKQSGENEGKLLAKKQKEKKQINLTTL